MTVNPSPFALQNLSRRAVFRIAILLCSISIASGCATRERRSSSAQIGRPITVTVDANQPTGPTASDPAASLNPPTSSKQSVADDACPKALHELCGPLLLYYAAHQRLPDRLDVLHDLNGANDSALLTTCPKTGQPYIYRPDSTLTDAVGDRIILYDATPAHAAGRWAVAIREPVPGKPLVTKVIPMAEPLFQKWQAAADAVAAPSK